MKHINNNYEYIFAPVPWENRKTTGTLLFVTAGFAFSPSAFSMGTELGKEMSFFGALSACLLGNFVLFLFALFWGLLAWQHGRSAVFLIKNYLGNKVSVFVSSVMLVFLILWIGANGGLISKLCISAFPSWPLPFTVTMMVMLSPIIYFSRWGLDNIVFFARLFTGVILALTLYCIAVILGQTGEVAVHLGGVQEYTMFFRYAVPRVIGNFALSTMMMADICRYAKRKVSVLICVSGYAGVLFLCNLCGILLELFTGARNFSYGVYLLHLTYPAFLLFLLCIYTTQNINLYSGSLALQEVLRGTRMGGNISHSTAVCFIGCAAIITGIFGIDRYISQFTFVLLPLVTFCTGAEIIQICRAR